MPIAASIKLNLTVTETLTGDDLNAESTLLHNGYDIAADLTASTAVTVTKCAYQTVNMTAGAATIDLTDLLLNAVAVTLTGLEPRALRVTALTTNGASITVAKGASNGYDGLGAAFSVTLEPGSSALFYFYSGTGNAVGSGNKNLDLSGTTTDGVRFSVVAGT
jgi:hypothetical protein